MVSVLCLLTRKTRANMGLQSLHDSSMIYKTSIVQTSLDSILTIVLVLLFTCGHYGPICVHSIYYDGDSSTFDEAFMVGGRQKPSYLKHSKSHFHDYQDIPPTGNWTEVGVSPPVLNLATKAYIEVNATCGESAPETYCKLVEHAHTSRRSHVRASQCQVCDAHSSDKGKRHPIRYTLDGSNRWWQSPTLQNGRHYEWVTITIDLKQIYQVAYIIIKAGISPRPGNWVLERSLDGYVYLPWQYYALSDDECWSRYRIRAKPGKPSYSFDDEVICTSYYSSITPFEGGEIHTSLVNGRPGADGPSEQLTRFTMARYVRLRLQKIRTLHGDLMAGVEGPLDNTVLRRYFYSIKDISIGGHCVCFGHANECVMDKDLGSEKCKCQHNTCGERCDICCPLYNQFPWGPGNSTDSATCQQCQCHGHADSCVYDRQIHEERRSKNILGMYDGGGVCIDCKHHTTGINCDICVEGYYRPKGVSVDNSNPCQKCTCHSEGSTGKCIKSEEDALKYSMQTGVTLQPGDCICREGFEGRSCDRCGVGYKNFPRCSPCPCHIAGIIDKDCNEECLCKMNVEGALCSNCKAGYFDLSNDNDLGCTQCFCHGVSNTCHSSNFSIIQMNDPQDWFVTDLHGTKTIAALVIVPHEFGDAQDVQLVDLFMSNKTFQIANEEFAQFTDYYFTTTPNTSLSAGVVAKHKFGFSGNKIHSYGLRITFRVSWVHARGDTSGRPIPNYDFILQGDDLMLGFGYEAHPGNNATITTVLKEVNCMVLPDVDNHITKIHERASGLVVGHDSQRRPGVPCTRSDVMKVLSNVKRVLFRAKFHTDQIEAVMHWAYMENALLEEKEFVKGLVIRGSQASSVEICQCPTGHTGTSCEQCSYGYRKLSQTSWPTVCVQCDCNGHSESCDYDGKCLRCDHHTVGEYCQSCETGYYGDPVKTKDVDACKKCECPLRLPSNNFSPTCEAKGSSYICTSCPVGHEGEHCERCGNGYYGNPTHPGDYCKPCQCSTIPMITAENNNITAEICDHLTGECLICPRNTVGWNCDECAPGHFINPLNGVCIPCECSEKGSTSTTSCNQDTGQCACKLNFAGRACDECLPGHGNPDDGCPICDCNMLGSTNTICNKVTGQCQCKQGVDGRYCNKCQDNHYGFAGGRGCVPCDCDPLGCDGTDLCDLESGQCHCLPHVTGRRCDTCEAGWWNLTPGKGCEPCLCDPDGSFGVTCNRTTGQCICKPGLGDLRCSQCLQGHWDKTHIGCKHCDPCNKTGHICNPENGRCVCPPNTEGENCEKCTVGYWGYSPVYGCQPCQCSGHGSVQPQCHPNTGKCNCQLGFEGDKCDRCKLGYFGYPVCHACNCDKDGTLQTQCGGGNGSCVCDIATGQCACKANVMGTNCDRCKPGYYGLDDENLEGCIQCFCFHRSNKCTQGYFKWQRLSLLNSKNLMILRSPGSAVQYLYVQFGGQDRCYVHFSMPPDRSSSSLMRSDSQLRHLNTLLVIPDNTRNLIIENDISFSMPLYWQLPHIFLGDKVLSYNGHFSFNTHSVSALPGFPVHVLATYPVVQIQGNHRLILEHFSISPYTTGQYKVRLHEDEWRLKNGPNNGKVSKEVMMVALQNLQSILIRATHSPEVFNSSLFNVSLDIAMPSASNEKTIAHGIEVCECPPEYNSTSCQNPRVGWYRWYKQDYITSTVIIDLVGEARRCDCNGRANSCNTETGRCQNCRENTTGASCEMCAEGYYGNPLRGRCLPCPCPTIWNNHAKSCHQRIAYPQWSSRSQHEMMVSNQEKWHCDCLQGYTGLKCDRCDYGYYGRPWQRGTDGVCTPCRCNRYGSVSDECDEVTGQCNCRPGVTGRDCSKCQDRHVILGKECTSCDDQCTGTLLNDLMNIHLKLSGLKVDPESLLVWKNLINLDKSSSAAIVNWNNAQAISIFLDDLPGYNGLSDVLSYRTLEIRKACENALMDSYLIVERGKVTIDTLEATLQEIRRNIRNLNNYAKGQTSNEKREMTHKELRDAISHLEHISIVLQQHSRRATEEVEEISTLFDQMLGKFYNESNEAGSLIQWMKATRNKLEQLAGWMDTSATSVQDAVRIMIRTKEDLDKLRSHVSIIDDSTHEIDENIIKTQSSVNNGGYFKTELEQVLFMIEDMLREFRNMTKELEIRDNLLFDQVPLYRVLYAQPAFDHELELKMQQKYIERLLGPLVGHGNGTQSGILGVTAFQRMQNSFKEAFEVANNARQLGNRTWQEIESILQKYPQAQLLETSSSLVDAGLVLSAQLEKGSLRRNLTDCKSSLEKLQWNLKLINETMRQMALNLDGYLDQSMRIPELTERISEISDTVLETTQAILEISSKVHNELKLRIDIVNGEGSSESGSAAVLVNRVSHLIPQVDHDIIQTERHLQEMVKRQRETLEDCFKYLKALIQQNRHKANTVAVSLGPDETGTCFRLYSLADIMDESYTLLQFHFAPTGTKDSLLMFWPSSLNEDFIAVEMVNLHVKVSWDLGSGLRTLTHPTKLHPMSLQSDDPGHWWEILVERIGSSMTLEVKPILEDPTVVPMVSNNVPITYLNLDEEATLMNLAPEDYLHIGGQSQETRTGLVDNRVLSGCIHNLRVNQKQVGLWNFARTEGCLPCFECPVTAVDTNLGSSGDSEYHFDGKGYAVLERIQSQTFNSRFFDVSFEFKTFSENGLLFLTVNQTVGQIISVELTEGRIVMQVNHQWGTHEKNDFLRVETQPPTAKYNNGEWTLVRALWVYQRGTQTAKLIVGKQDFTQAKQSRDGKQLSLKLHQANYQVGGVSPTFDSTKWAHVLPAIVPYAGCIKNVLVDGSRYDLLGGHYFGVESPCGGRSVYVTSFEGNGYAEFGSVPISRNFKMGFSFKTVKPRGLMLLSTFAKGLESPDAHYYAVYLDQGLIKMQLGVPQGPFELFSNNGTRYDDGRVHSIRFFKKGRKLFLYVDDEEQMELRIPKQATVNAPNNRGLFIGGTTAPIKQKFVETPLPVRDSYHGCIQNLYFGNSLINFNYPVSQENQKIGQCPKHDDLDVAKHHYPNKRIDSSAVLRNLDPACSSAVHTSSAMVIEQEDLFKAWHFGDSHASYATLNLLSSKVLRQSFNISFMFRTFYPNGMFFQGLKKQGSGGYCLMSFLKDGQVIVKMHGNRPQDLVSSVSSLNDGNWHRVEIIKAEDKMYLHIDSQNATQTQVPKLKAIGKIHIGGVPSDGHDCVENAIQKPEFFKGCLKNFIINSHFYNLDTNTAQLSNVRSCFKTVEPGSFFRNGSYAIYSHNMTIGTMFEVQLDFKSDSTHGLLITIIPNKLSSRYPQFSIFLQDGKVIAREVLRSDHYYEATANLRLGNVCDGQWHTIRANYERGSITLRLDEESPIFALADPDLPHARLSSNLDNSDRITTSHSNYIAGVGNGAGPLSTVGTIYIGGIDDGTNRSIRKFQFHGCIRNIVINRQIRDWTDMAVLQNVYLNSCPP